MFDKKRARAFRLLDTGFPPFEWPDSFWEQPFEAKMAKLFELDDAGELTVREFLDAYKKITEGGGR